MKCGDEQDAHLFDHFLDIAGNLPLAIGLFELKVLVEHMLVDLEVGQDRVLSLEDLHCSCNFFVVSFRWKLWLLRWMCAYVVWCWWGELCAGSWFDLQKNLGGVGWEPR